MEFYLRHTVYTKITRSDAIDANRASVDIKDAIKECLEERNIFVEDLDTQNYWELVAQEKAQRF